MTPTASRRALLAAAGAVALAGCGRDARAQSPSPSSSPPPGQRGTFVFGHAAPAPTLDPSLTDTGEVNRIAHQICDGLTAADPLTGRPSPGLAERWIASDDGLTVDFHLRPDVAFHDGSPVDAQAVVENVQRWASRSVRDTRTGRHSFFDAVFRRGTPQGSLYRGCSAPAPDVFRLRLARRHPSLDQALTHPAFGIVAPSSLRAGTAGTAPIGSGPFRVVEGLQEGEGQRPGQHIVLEALPEHWSGAASFQRLEFVAIPDPQMRRIRLLNGDVDAYDFVGLDSFAPLARDGCQIFQRDPYTLTYLGMHSGQGPLRSLGMREAVMSALDRQALVREHFPQGTIVANDFLPARFDIPDKGAGFPGYNPQQVRELLDQEGYDGAPLRFLFPTGTSRIWALEPERLYADLSAQLTRAGLIIEPVPVEGSAYMETLRTRSLHHDLFLSGIAGGFRDPDCFAAVLFGSETPELGLDAAGLRDLVEAAARQPDGPARQDLYRRVGARATRHRAALPLCFPISAVAASPRVVSFPLTSTGYESFHRLQLAR